MGLVLRLAKLQMLSCIRRQLHLVTLFSAFLLLMLPSYINLFELGQTMYHRVCLDMGLVAIGFYGLFYGLYFGSTTIPTDIEKRTVYPILAKPVSIWQYVLGQYLGVSILAAASFLFLGLCFFGSASLLSLNPEDPGFFLVLGVLYFEAQVITALCFALSIRFRPVVAAVIAFVIYFIGGVSESLMRVLFLGRDADGAALWAVRMLKACLPCFEVFHVKGAVVSGLELTPFYALSLLGYGVGWIVLLLWLGVIQLQKRDL